MRQTSNSRRRRGKKKVALSSRRLLEIRLLAGRQERKVLQERREGAEARKGEGGKRQRRECEETDMQREAAREVVKSRERVRGKAPSCTSWIMS